MEFEFNVGDSETHTVRVCYTRSLSNRISIQVDGTEVRQEHFRVFLPRFRQYNFQVGNGEQHHVLIDTSLPRFGRGLSDPTFKVSVDGEFLRQYKGVS